MEGGRQKWAETGTGTGMVDKEDRYPEIGSGKGGKYDQDWSGRTV